MGHPSSTTRDRGAPYPSSVPVSPEHDRVAVHTAVTDAQRTCCPLMSSEEMYVKHSSACVRDSSTCVWQQHLFAIHVEGIGHTSCCHRQVLLSMRPEHERFTSVYSADKMGRQLRRAAV